MAAVFRELGYEAKVADLQEGSTVQCSSAKMHVRAAAVPMNGSRIQVSTGFLLADEVSAQEAQALKAANEATAAASFARSQYASEEQAIYIHYSLPVPPYGFDPWVLKAIDGAVEAEINQALAGPLKGLLK